MRHSLLNNLEAFYPFDGNLSDSAGNGHSLVNLIKTATPSVNVLASYSTGKKNSAISFSNSEQSVRATSEILGGTEQGFSVSFWYNLSSISAGNAGVFSTDWRGLDKTTYAGFETFYVGGCDLNFVIYNQPNETTRGQFILKSEPNLSNVTQVIADNIPVTLNQWQHVVYTFVHSTSTQHIFINGQLFNNSSISFPDPEPYFRFRCFRLNDCRNIFDYAPQSFQGSIDSLGIWSKVLTSTEVAKLYNNGNGLELTIRRPKPNIKTSLAAFYKFENTLDTSILSNPNGGIVNLSTYRGKDSITSKKADSPKFSQGKIGRGIDLKGNNILTSGEMFNVNQIQFRWTLQNFQTYSFWANLSQLECTLLCEQNLFTMSVDGAGRIIISYYPNWNQQSTIVSNQGIIKPNEWLHFAIIFEDQFFAVYLNGCCVIKEYFVSFVSSPPGPNTFFPTVLGGCASEYRQNSWEDPISNIQGNPEVVKFDSLGLWQRRITLQEVNLLYNEGKGLDLYDFGSYYVPAENYTTIIKDKAEFVGKTQFLDPMGYSWS